jgi:uncharacterized protein involved in outer membrane biogenesis
MRRAEPGRAPAATGHWHRLGVAVLVLAGLALALVIAAFVAGVSIDASRWRELASKQASAALGRPVVLRGALRLTLGRELLLRIGELQVTNPPGFTAPQWLSVGEARVALDLFDLPGLLRGAPRLQRVEADDVVLWLERTADGRGSWSTAVPRAPRAAGVAIDIGQIGLKRVAVRYHDARSATRRELDLEAVSGRAGPDGAVHLSLRGLADARPAYRLRIDGGPLRLLRDAAEPWPFKLDFHAPGAWLQASGVLDGNAVEARFDFDATVDDPARAARWLGLALPRVGMVSVRGSAKAGSETIELTRLQGTLPGADFSGQLALALGGARARLTGALRIDDLDLQRWFGALPGAHDGWPEHEGRAWQSVALRDLLAVDAELDLSVQRCAGLPVELRDARVALHADARGLHVPVSVQASGARVSGRLDLDAAATTPTLTLELAASELPLGDLTRALWNVQGVDGTLGHLDVQLGGRGETLGAWLQDLEASLVIAGVDAHLHGGQGDRPVALALDQLTLVARRGERVHGKALGTALGERFAVSMQAGRLSDMLGAQALPIELDLETAPATLRIATDLAAAPAAQGRALSFDFRARRSGDLARWLGVAAESALPVALRGRMHLTDDTWRLDAATLRLGRSDLALQAGGARSAGGPLTTARVRSELLDGPELATLFAAARTGRAERPGRPPDAALRVGPVGFAQADLELDLQRVQLGRATLSDVGVVARFRHGQWSPSPIKGRVGGASFDGVVALDLRGQAPLARLDLSAREVDIGPLLLELGAAEAIIDGRADALQFSLQGQGRNWREFVAGAEVQAQLVGGNIAVRPAMQRPVAEIRLRDAAIGAAPGEPLRLRLDGALGHTPVRIELSSGTLAELLRDDQHLPLALSARAAGTLLTLDGRVALPLGRDADLRLQMSGERLDSLSELSRAQLPAWGPWSIGGPVHMTPAGYEVQGLQAIVGQSRLVGSGQLDLSGPRPHLALQVTAPSIQLDDFPLPQRLVDPHERPGPSGGVRGTVSELSARADHLLSARVLRRLDASIDVQAKEVMAGADRLADGFLRLRLREGRLDLDPAVVNLPGGSLRLSLAYDLKESELDFAIAAEVERFDYGIIARRLRRADDVRGLFSMNLKLQGRAPSLDSIMRRANGQLDVAVWPTELRAGVFNFWSVNLVLTLLPMIDPRAPSQVNCMVGRFDLRDGIFGDDKIVIDTTAVRIRGAGQVNLETEQLDFVFRPRAKGFAVFRLQNPLRVTGTLTDQRIGLDHRDAVASTLRLIASPVLWPIEWFTLGPLPRDGSDICTDPLRAAGR